MGAGIVPRYGDGPPLIERRPAPARPFDRSDYDFLEKIYARTGEAGEMLAWVANGAFDFLRGIASAASPIPDRRVQAGMSLYREPGAREGGSFTDRAWMLFHAGDAPKGPGKLDQEWQRRVMASDFYGQKGMAILRAGSQELLLRFGPSLQHGHFDDLNINYIARGYEMTYDIGYGHSATTQTQVGWAKQTASHNLVMVDERPQQEGGRSGGSLELFADMPLLKVAEASSANSYSKQNVREYRRLSALVGEGDDAYLLDLFRVAGGAQHDWLFHALGDRLSVSGVTLGPKEPGSLGGVTPAWSEAQLSDGNMQGHAGNPAWNPPPGNGLGFYGDVRRGKPPGAWSAEWRIDDATRLRLFMPQDPAGEVITATASGLYPHYPKAGTVILRRRGSDLESNFAAAVEAHGGEPKLQQIARTETGFRVTHRDGTEDYFYRSQGFAMARVRGGKLEAATLIGVKRLEVFGWTIEPETDAWSGAVESLDVEHDTFTTTARLPDSLLGAVIVFRNPAYTRSTGYRIRALERTGQGTRVRVHSTFRLGIGEVEAVKDGRTITTMIPHEYVFSDKTTGAHSFFTGKQVRTPAGAASTLRAMRSGLPMTLTVDDSSVFKTGDRIEYLDVQAGDRFEVLSAVEVRPGAKPQVRGNAMATVRKR